MSIYRLLLLLPLLLCSFVVSDAGTNASAAEPVSQALYILSPEEPLSFFSPDGSKSLFDRYVW